MFRPGDRCPACDYDLTGAPGPLCPECGAAPAELARDRTTHLASEPIFLAVFSLFFCAVGPLGFLVALAAALSARRVLRLVSTGDMAPPAARGASFALVIGLVVMALHVIAFVAILSR